MSHKLAAITPLERLVWRYVAQAFANEEIQEILRETHGIEVHEATVRNAIRRLLSKLQIPEELSGRNPLKRRMAERVRLARRYWEDELPLRPGVGLVSSREADFYDLGSQLLRTANHERVIFATKTPVLLLAREVNTPERRVYYRDLLSAAEIQMVKGQYLICLPRTLDEMRKLRPGTDASKAQDEHFRRATFLEYRGLIRTRFVTGSDFNSCILGPRYGAVLHKDPTADRVILVERVERRQLALYNRYFDEVLKTAGVVDPQRLRASAARQSWC